MFNGVGLRDAVCAAYSAAARQPADKHPFPVGREFAESLGYPAELLDSLPDSAADAFAGVSNVALFAEINVACTILDLGCGAGLDALIAARRTGPSGRVYGVDFSNSMLERANRAAREAGAYNVEFMRGDAEQLPLPDGSIDIALTNGIFNLNHRRAKIFSELARVVRPGGTMFGAELILVGPRPENERTSATNWFA